MQDLKPHYLIFALLFIFEVFSGNYACNQIERNSLLSLHLNSSPTSLNWSSINCCHWEGISCDHKGRVTHLWLPSKGLIGTISPSRANFTRISHLNLSHNLLTSLLPAGLFSFFNELTVLDLSHNHQSGQIPRGLGGCSKLKIFWAGFNSLAGFLPHDVYDASALEEISLPSNDLSGHISNEIMNLTKLTSLELYENQLSGNLPLNIGKLSLLEHLSLHTNQLAGTFSQVLSNCTNLIHLDLRANLFDENITELNLSSLHRLTILDLGDNNLVVSGNKLTNITAAIKILMRCKIQEVAILRSNFLKVSVPADVSMIDSDGFQNLQVLDLKLCQLTGKFPIWISKAKNLQVLFLHGNRITGSIPGWLSTLPRLSTIYLSDNLFSGEFPKELCALRALVSAQAVDYNSSFTIAPIFLRRFYLIKSFHFFSGAMQLRNNSFSGTIPIAIGCLKGLRLLDLSYKKLTGTIPTQISELTELEELDLSANQLYGEIPESLTSLHFLHFFNISNNNLHGVIPVGTQLQTFEASAFEGNPGLCGYPLLQCSHLTISKRDENIQEEEDKFTISWFHVTVVLGFITGFWGVCAPLVLNKNWRPRYFRSLIS